MNLVIITGNLGADPKVNKTKSDLTVANLSIATNERIKQGNEWIDHTEWHNVVVFGGQAETSARFLTKGSKVAIHGKLRTRKWTTEDGQERRTTEIVADRVEFMSKPPNSQSTMSSPPPSSKWPEDEIPF